MPKNNNDKKELSLEDKKKIMYQAFSRAMANMPLDNIITKRKNNYNEYTNEQIQQFLKNPVSNESNIRKVVDYLIFTSPQFNLLCNYLPYEAMIKYTLLPVMQKLDGNLDIQKYKKDYLKCALLLQKMNIEQEFLKAIQICMYYDVYYGYEIETNDSYFLKSLDPDYCRISGSDDGCIMFDFNFAYFKGREKLIYGDELGRVGYPDEFRKKYELYQKDSKTYQWQSLDKGVCLKYNESRNYPIPPYVGLFEDIMDLKDYKELNKAKVESDNYKLIALNIPLDTASGEPDKFLLSMKMIELFLKELNNQVPAGVGYFPTPMKPQEMTFKKDGASTKNEVADATQNLFDATGFSKLLFSGAENSTALKYSVQTDTDKLYHLYRQIERIVNRKLKLEMNGKFMINILDISRFTRQDYIDTQIKACTYGVPNKLKLAASLGNTPLEILSSQILENDILGLTDSWIPLRSSNTSNSNDITNKGGRPETDEPAESTQQNREDGSNSDRV